MDTTREKVNTSADVVSWVCGALGNIISGDIVSRAEENQCDAARKILRALAAERDTLKALCVELFGVVSVLSNGEFSELLTRARSILS